MKCNKRFENQFIRRCFFLLLAIVSVSITDVFASATFNPTNKYKIVCCQYMKGGIALGAEHNRQTALYYVTLSENEEDMLWYIDEKAPGYFSIRNAKSGQYITYDGLYSGSMKRYVTMTSEIKGDSSLWKVFKSDNGSSYMISSALDVDTKCFNVRSNYVVGTFAEQQSSNSLFYFCNEDGSKYVPVERDDDNCGTTLDNMYWENTGLKMPVAMTTDIKNPILYSIKNIRSGRYIKPDTDHRLTQTVEAKEQFYFVRTSDGINIYTKDGGYVSGFISGLDGKEVQTVDGTTDTDDNVWNIEYATMPPYSGYGIYVVKCSKNGDDNKAVNAKKNYWNDYYKTDVCFFSLDNGSTFLFYSSDERHRQYLSQNSIYVPQKGSSGNVSDVRSLLENFSINHKTVVFDKKYNNYMLPLPETCRGNENLIAEVRYEHKNNENFQLYIDGETIENGSNYTFKGIGKGQNHEITIIKDGKKIGSANLLFTFMPIVELNGTNFTSVYRAGTIRVNDPNSKDVVDSLYNANVRYRGATAMGKQKKAYAIKLKDKAGNSIDRKLLNLRNDNNWILDAMAVDAGRMRNRIATDLWNDFSTAPYHAAYEKKIRNGTRGKFVEVLLNGYYAGIYCMTEKVDRKQLKLKKYAKGVSAEVPDTVKGTLYKSSEWTYEVFMGHEIGKRAYPMTAPSSYNNHSEVWGKWENKYPDLQDKEPIDWEPLYRAVNLVAAGTQYSFSARASVYFDLPVFLDYYLFIELMLATDNHGKNMYLYNYDSSKYKKLGVAPWDLDGVFGRRWDGSTNLTANAKQDFITFLWSYEHGEHTLFKRLMEYDVNGWNKKLAARYAQLRPTYFSHASLLNRFKNYRELFRESGADQREIRRWQGSDGITMDFDKEISYMDRWLKQRLETLDAQYNYVVPDGIHEQKAPYIGVSGGVGKIYVHTTTPDVAIKVYNLMGALLKSCIAKEGVTCIDNMAPGIYLVNNHKVVVR